MSHTGYLIPPVLLATMPPATDWHAIPVPGDPTHSLVVIEWDNPNLQPAFEAQTGVVPLGFPWESLPAVAVPLFQMIQSTVASTDTVAQALRKFSWPGARLVR